MNRGGVRRTGGLVASFLASALLGAAVHAQDVSKGNDALTADPVNRSVEQPANDFSDFDDAPSNALRGVTIDDVADPSEDSRQDSRRR